MKIKRTVTFIYIVTLFFVIQNNLYSQVPELEKQALIALYNSTDGANWTNNTNWLSEEPVDSWYGVIVVDDRVEQLSLGVNNLTGSIPDEIGNLTNLNWLILQVNNLTGPIPETIGNLVNLEYIYLNHNQLTDTIPDVIYDLTGLRTLSLMNNYGLGGQLKSEIGNLINLEYLLLESMSLEGSIPDEICLLTNLIHLRLGNNETILGSIPLEIGNLTNLSLLSLYNNSLTGTIPESIGNLENIQVLVLADNYFHGTIPEAIGNLINLAELQLQKNNFSGAVPDTLNNLMNLTYLPLYNNNFHDLPDLSSLVSLNSLHIYNNAFTFEDIEPNIGVPQSLFEYSPQDSVESAKDTTITVGDSLVLSVFVGGSENRYRWLRNGRLLAGGDSNIYKITDAQRGETGSYICEITNTIVPDLTIYRRPVYVQVDPPSGLPETLSELPGEFKLNQNYPNPFNPTTKINYELRNTDYVELNIYNILGKKVTTLVSEKQTAGTHQVEWNASGFPGGVYFYRVKAGSNTDTKKMFLVK